MNTDIIILLAKLKKLHKTFIENTNSTSSSIKHLEDEIVRLEELIMNIGGGGSGGEGGLNESQVNILIKRQIDELQAVIENEINGLRTELTEQIKSNTGNIEQVTVKLENVNKEINSIKEQLTLLQTDNVEIKESLSTMENSLKETNEEITVMLTKIEDTVKEIEVLRQEVNVIEGNLQKQIDEIIIPEGLTEEEVNTIIDNEIKPILLEIVEINNKIENLQNNGGGSGSGGEITQKDLDDMMETIRDEIKESNFEVMREFNPEIYNLNTSVTKLENISDETKIDLDKYVKVNVFKNTGDFLMNLPVDIYVKKDEENPFPSVTVRDEQEYLNNYVFPTLTVVKKFTDEELEIFKKVILGRLPNENVKVDMREFSTTVKVDTSHDVELVIPDEIIETNERGEKFIPIAKFKYDLKRNDLILEGRFAKVYDMTLDELKKGITVVGDYNPPLEYDENYQHEVKATIKYGFDEAHERPEEKNVPSSVLNTMSAFTAKNDVTGNYKIAEFVAEYTFGDMLVVKAYEHRNPDIKEIIYRPEIRLIKIDSDLLKSATSQYKNDGREIIFIPNFNYVNDESNIVKIKPPTIPKLNVELRVFEGNIDKSNQTYESMLKNKTGHNDSFPYGILTWGEDLNISYESDFLIVGDVNYNTIISSIVDNTFILNIVHKEHDSIKDKILKITSIYHVWTFRAKLFEYIRNELPNGEKFNIGNFNYHKQQSKLTYLTVPIMNKLNLNDKLMFANMEIVLLTNKLLEEYVSKGIEYIPVEKLPPLHDNHYDYYSNKVLSIRNKNEYKKVNTLYEDAVQGNGINGKVYTELNNQLIEGERLHLDTNIGEESNKDIVSHQKYAYYKNNIMQKINSINISNSLKITDSWDDLINKENLGELKNVFNMLSGEIKLTESLANSLVNIINTKVLLQLTKDGDLRIGGQLQSNYADYAEMFELETPLSEDDKIAKIVKLNSNGKVEFAQKGDKPLGIVSVNASVVGDNPHQWKGMYVKDRYGREIKGIVLQYSPFVQFANEEEINNILTKLNDIRKQNELTEVVNSKKSEDDNEDEVILINRPLTLKDVLSNIDAIPEDKVDEVEQLIKYTDGITNTIRELYKDLDNMNLLNVKEISILVELYKTKQLDKEDEFTLKDINMNTGSVLSLAYDSNKSYIMREHRDDWVKVGLLGKLIVNYEGNVKTGDYLTTGDNGKAILSTSESNMQVLEVVDEELALVYFK